MIYVVQTDAKKNKTMNLKTLKNLYAQEQGYEDWQAFVYEYGEENPDWHDYGQAHPNNFDKHMDEICIRAQKVALEKAAENAEIHRLNLVSGHKFTGKNTVSLSGERTIFSIHKESITNPENLIR